MDFSFTEEQEALRRTLREFLGKRADSAAVRRAMESADGYDAEAWQVVTGQLGLAALAVPEEYGGLGASWAEVAVALEETGRALLPAPLLSSTLAAAAIVAGADEAGCGELLPGLAEGAVVGAVALGLPGHPPRLTTEARPAGAGWTLSGVEAHVLDGQLADLVVVAAATPDGPALFAVEAGADGLTRTPLTTVDQTRRQARLAFADAPARRVGGAAAVGRAGDLCGVALAAEALGGARRCLELTVAHLSTREQFGRPLGSFQALKHRAADLVVDIESAASTAYYAAWAAADAPDELPLLGPLAKSYCSEVFLRVAADTIQLHGGIGFTWEHDAHLYFKRAKATEQLFGAPHVLRRTLAERAGIGPAGVGPAAAVSAAAAAAT